MKQEKKGFTFVELIVAVLVLSLGVVLIYEGFLTSLGGFNYCIDYLDAQLWMDEKIWDMQDKLSNYKTLLTEDSSGSFIIGGKEFRWNLIYNLIEGSNRASLYETNLKVFWKEGLGTIETIRGAYLLYMEK